MAPRIDDDGQRKKLVLCFDGTGNEFHADSNSRNTNIVKIFQKLDRDTNDQYHYYQPGIGTYNASWASLNLPVFGSAARSIAQTLDEGFASDFDAHVMGAYQFVMRFYGQGDLIYLFGFSRGAFTARFVARMICSVGLLSRGNEEMVAFAYKMYKDCVNRSGPFKGKSDEQIRQEMDMFKTTFCRSVVPHFLGVFDTVNSVEMFPIPFKQRVKLVAHGPKSDINEQFQYDSRAPTAHYVRHACSIDERRVRFKPALLCPSKNVITKQEDDPDNPYHATNGSASQETIPHVREVFFAGDHSDIGGGHKSRYDTGSWHDKSVQLPDITLNWMLEQLEELNDSTTDEAAKLNFNRSLLDEFTQNFKDKRDKATIAEQHDSLQTGKGANFFMVGFWWLLEILPTRRLELIKGKWQSLAFPPNLGASRDIPKSADIHDSVRQRIVKTKGHYMPRNDGLEELRADVKKEVSYGSPPA